jgi:hypothetical protein
MIRKYPWCRRAASGPGHCFQLRTADQKLTSADLVPTFVDGRPITEHGANRVATMVDDNVIRRGIHDIAATLQIKKENVRRTTANVFTWHAIDLMNHFSRNRLSPRYINIATTPYNKETAGANSTTKPKRKYKRRKEKLMPTSPGQRKR